MSRKAALLQVLSLLVCLCGCTGQDRHVSVRDATLSLSISGDPKSFNPIVAKETSTTAITGYIFEGLVQTDGESLEVKPCLATRWESDESGKVWRFFLRKNVKWHDGEEFTSDDVVFTYNRLIYNERIATSSRDVLSIDGKPLQVSRLDDYTVEFRLPERFAPFLRLMGHEILPEHRLSGTVDKGTFGSSWGVNESSGNIVGTGPFVLREYRPAEWVILDRNNSYWKVDQKTGERLPRLKRIVFSIIADTNMALLKFRAGEIDVFSVRGQDYPLLKPYEKKQGFTIYQLGPSLGSEFISFNQSLGAGIKGYRREWFRNKNFRKAVAHAIDKEAIVRNVYGGFASRQDGPMNVSCGFFNNPDVEKYDYDLERAKKLLQSEGFRLRDSFLYDAMGNPVEFSIITNSNNFERIQIGNIIQDDLKKTGMKVNLLPVEFNTLVTRLTSTMDWECVIIGLTGGIEPHNGKNVWHSRGQLHVWNNSPESREAWEKKVDRIFEEGAKTTVEKRRKKLYDEWQEIASDQLPLIYTVSPFSMVAVNDRVVNIRPSVYGGALHNIEELSVGPASSPGGH